MVSKILIDIDENNLPVIIVDYARDTTDSNEDLKDKLIKRFIEGFGNDSNLAHVEFSEHTVHYAAGSRTRKVLTIRPMSNINIHE